MNQTVFLFFQLLSYIMKRNQINRDSRKYVDSSIKTRKNIKISQFVIFKIGELLYVQEQSLIFELIVLNDKHLADYTNI